ncbi:hypothetical protein F8568_001465 [Actinomadura sp. LD22]|uniref:Uncharacterized protein n=1 Tax=Actinomadura physcomitrii TaxID=2650748 RepID=A0A6I4M4I3_9ACTN|nr:hypothetical protein [Actinomadura physcomitrii]MVZ99076.1 hypothetical protein [Actinomadura physcomitrii]
MSLRQTRTIRPKPATEPGTTLRVEPTALDVVVAGAHGGAGTSTLAALLPAAWDMGSIESLLELDQAPLRAKGRPIVLTVRNTAAAATRATTAISVLRDWDERVAGLAIVSDGGPESREATARFALLEARVGGIVRIPHVRQLRLVEDPAEVVLPGKARHALDQLRRLIDAAGDGAATRRGQRRREVGCR